MRYPTVLLLCLTACGSCQPPPPAPAVPEPPAPPPPTAPAPVVAPTLPAPPAAPAAGALSLGPPTLRDRFEAPQLDRSVWIGLRDGDFKAAKTDTVDVGEPDSPDRRLRLATNTLGTDDATVKHLGVRTAQAFDFSMGRRFAVNVDWNDQKNSAYLTAAIYLVPTAEIADPSLAPDWLRWEFAGVPQDNLVRASVSARRKGHLRQLERFGWPGVRKGRPVGNHRIEIEIDKDDVVIREQGKEVFRLQGHRLTFTQAALYLVMTSHSNYSERSILFDDVLIEPLKG